MTSARRTAVALAAIVTVVVVALAAAFDAAASTPTAAHPRNAVAAITVDGGQVVGTHPDVLAGERRARATDYDRIASGSSVAAEAGDARFAVDSAGEATMSVRAGSESLEVTQHTALRMTQRGISIDAVESTLSQPSFDYFHQGVWKVGYYDPVSRVFVGSVNGVVTTVIDNVSQNYINNLLAAAP